MLRVMYERKTHKSADKLSIPQLENALHMYAATPTFPPGLFLTGCTPSTKQPLKKTASSSHATSVVSSDTTQQPYPEGPTLVTEQAQLFLWNSEQEGFEAAFQDLIEASLVQVGQFQCKSSVSLSRVVEG
jgi:hypothetical protein